MKGKALIPLVVGLAVGLVAIKYTMDAVKKAGADTTEYTPVVVAVTDIPSTWEIKPEMIRVIKSPRTPLLPPDAYTKTEDLIGRVAQKSIPQGAPVLPTMIAPKGTLPGLIVRVKEGYRAVSVKIDESSGVGYLVRPNDWVDVLVVMDQQKRGRRETISRVILQNVQVGAVGQALGNAAEETTTGSRHAKSVTLLVKKEDAPKLHLAQTRGRITLAMRGVEDTQVGESAEASESEMLGTAGDTQSAQAGKGKSSGKGSFFGKLFGQRTGGPASAPARPPVAARVQPPPNREVSVTVVNGTASHNAQAQVQRVTFSDDNSMNVVSVQNGMSTPGRKVRTPRRDSPFFSRRASKADSDSGEEATGDQNSGEVAE